jgi:predicted TIM-barrel enzyme
MQGSMEYAAEQLERYRNVLESRVIAYFDEAVAHGDLSSMRHCARIMAEFKRGEAALVQVGDTCWSFFFCT